MLGVHLAVFPALRASVRSSCPFGGLGISRAM